MGPDLVKVSEIFLVPSSFLVAALAAADTYPHKAAVSVLGLIVSVLWLICSLEALPPRDPAQGPAGRSRRIRVLAWLPIVFMVGWLISVGVHGWLSWL